ncbi:MAG: phosphoribosylanthranilate isomerase [Candidatus Zipacnadales bacterium]
MDPKPIFVKICGLSRLSDMRVAETSGAAYVGFIVEVPRSPRRVTREQAAFLCRAARANTVMVTVSSEGQEIAEVARFVKPTVVQLHRSIPNLLGELRETLPHMELWQVVAVESGLAPQLEEVIATIEAARHNGADKIVLDSAMHGLAGGTGIAMDWDVAAQLVEIARPLPVVLAGGLNIANVAQAIRQVKPAGVDVSSGVETTPNVKSPRLIRTFTQTVLQITKAQ